MLANLEELDLSENELGEGAAPALAASFHLGKLRRLDLRQNPLGPAGAEALAGGGAAARAGTPRPRRDGPRRPAVPFPPRRGPAPRPVAGSERERDRPGRAAGDAGPGPAGAGPGAELDLSHNELGEAGWAPAEAPLLAGLSGSRMIGGGITDDGLRAVAASPHLNKFALLTSGTTRSTMRDTGRLIYSQHFKVLRRLVYSRVGVSRWMQEAIDRRFHRPPVRR